MISFSYGCISSEYSLIDRVFYFITITFIFDILVAIKVNCTYWFVIIFLLLKIKNSNTTAIEKIQEEIKSFREFKISAQKLVKNNIFYTDSNGTGSKDEIASSYIGNILKNGIKSLEK